MAHDQSRRPQSIEDTSIDGPRVVCRRDSYEKDRQREQVADILETHNTARKTVDVTANPLTYNRPDAIDTSITNKILKLPHKNKDYVSKQGENKKFSELDQLETDCLKSNITGIKSEKEQCSVPLLTFDSSDAAKVFEADLSGTQTEGLFQQDIPHGELSPMSSGGLYQEIMPSSNQSTDNGYVTLTKR